MTHLHEEKLESEQVFKGVLLDVRKDRVRLPNGGESVREYVVHPGARRDHRRPRRWQPCSENQFYPLQRDF